MSAKKKKLIVSVVGARPQFMKVQPLDAAIKKSFQHYIIHTGQHYDDAMSKVFFLELGIPLPKENLAVGSGSHSTQTGNMLIRLGDIFERMNPALVVVYGDTNSTLAATLAASKLHIPVAHVEAGMRSFNRFMPEEINRVITDHIADLHFCSSAQAVSNLRAEGVHHNVFYVGDIMLDLLKARKSDSQSRDTLTRFGLTPKSYILATVHRPGNTDHKSRIASIVRAMTKSKHPIVLSAHPRLEKQLSRYNLLKTLQRQSHIHIIPPQGYLDMINLQSQARAILTDSGGIQKEAFFMGTPCITLRPETEWTETVDQGWNILVDSDEKKILQAIDRTWKRKKRKQVYGTGSAGQKINQHLLRFFERAPGKAV